MRNLYLMLLSLLCGPMLFAHDPVLPTGFVMEEAFVAGLNRPTDVKIAPDGRIFIAEKGGTIRIVENGELLPAPFYAVETQTPGERGLDGIALDPDFDNNGFVYMYYSLPNENRNIVAKVVAAGNTAIPGSEIELIRLDEMWAAFHNGAALVFDTTGALLVAVGDGTRGVDAQSMTTSLGKILRIHPDGSIPTDNPFYNQNQGLQRAIAAYGVRNPYTMAISSLTGRVFFNDVGNLDFEEVNEYIMGSNYGWHDIEGMLNGANPPDNRYKDPIHVYDHDFGCAIVGATFYEPEVNLFPEALFGNYFFMEFCDGKVLTMNPDNFEVEVFGTGLDAGYNNIEASADGYLYLINFNNGNLSRISYQGVDAKPLISVQPVDQIVAVGEDMGFSVNAVGEDLTYTWFRDGVELSEPGNILILTNVQLADDQATFSVRVSNAHGAVTSNTVSLTVVNGTRPTIQMQGIPATYAAGDTLSFAATVSDPDQQAIPADDLTWSIDFHHDIHFHPAMGPLTGTMSGEYVIGTYGEVDTNVYFRVHVSATDSTGLTTSTYENVWPEKVSMWLQSAPAGVEINIDGMKQETDFTLRSVRNLTRTLEVPPSAIVGDSLYAFTRWDDGGTALTRAFSAASDTIGMHYQAIAAYDPGFAAPGNMEAYTGIGSNREFFRAVQVARLKENWDLASPFWHDSGFPSDSFSVVWTGSVVAPVSDWYTFYLLHDGMVSLELDGNPVIDRSAAPTYEMVEDSVRIWLDQGDFLNLKVDYEHYVYASRIELDWQFSILERGPIPFSALEQPNTPGKSDDVIRIFPNPVEKDVLYLCLNPEAEISEFFHVEIFDLTGRRFTEQTFYNSPPETISYLPEGFDQFGVAIPGLVPGVYILRMYDENRSHVQRFLKR